MNNFVMLCLFDHQPACIKQPRDFKPLKYLSKTSADIHKEPVEKVDAEYERELAYRLQFHTSEQPCPWLLPLIGVDHSRQAMVFPHRPLGDLVTFKRNPNNYLSLAIDRVHLWFACVRAVTAMHKSFKQVLGAGKMAAHCDLKPQNFLVREATDVERKLWHNFPWTVEITDLALVSHGSKPSQEGTHVWSADEQGTAYPDVSMDVFGLGSTLYFLLFDCPPFSSFKEADRAHDRIHFIDVLYDKDEADEEDPAPGTVSDVLCFTIQGCLAKDPSMRPTLKMLHQMARMEITRLQSSSSATSSV